MIKKIPLRKCVATGEQLPKKDLLRIVKNSDNKVFVDLSGRQNGRGAYIKKSFEALDVAIKKNCLGRALEIVIPDEIYAEIRRIISG